MPPFGIETLEGHRYGCSQKENVAVTAWYAPLGGCPEEADLCRGQGFRRTAPSASPRPEDRHVQGSPGPQGQERRLIRTPVVRQDPGRRAGHDGYLRRSVGSLCL